jgi:hypothetical protein
MSAGLAARLTNPGYHSRLATQEDNGHGMRPGYLMAQAVGARVTAGTLLDSTKPHGDGSLDWHVTH